MKIAPSILSANFADLKTELNKLSQAKADLIHLDVMDGHYVPNLTFGVPVIEAIRKVSTLPFDVHLMVTNPSSYIDALAEIENVAYISWHPETDYHNHRLIDKVKSYGIKAGWALNPATSIDIIDPVLDDLDFILLMSVNPGYGGQKFIPSIYKKLSQLQEKVKDRQTLLEVQVDGGVNSENAQQLSASGVTILVAGSYIFSSNDYAAAIASLKR